MSLVNTMVQLQLELFLLMFIGFVCKKIGMINGQAQRSMSDILIYVMLPCNILHSFTSGVRVSSELLKNCMLAFIISFFLQIFATYIGKLLFKSIQKKRLVSPIMV